jgi:hypothetical protein
VTNERCKPKCGPISVSTNERCAHGLRKINYASLDCSHGLVAAKSAISVNTVQSATMLRATQHTSRLVSGGGGRCAGAGLLHAIGRAARARADGGPLVGVPSRQGGARLFTAAPTPAPAPAAPAPVGNSGGGGSGGGGSGKSQGGSFKLRGVRAWTGPHSFPVRARRFNLPPPRPLAAGVVADGVPGGRHGGGAGGVLQRAQRAQPRRG